MNWRTKRQLLLGSAVVLTLAPLCWLGAVAWRLDGLRRAVARSQSEVAMMATGPQQTVWPELVDPEGLEPLPAPGGETASAADAVLDAVELALHENVAEFLGGLERLAVGTGMTVLAAEFVPSNTQGRTTYEIHAQGTADQLCRFVSSIERLQELSIVESLHLVGLEDGGIEARVGVARFHQ